MPLQKLQLRPGVNREGTTLANEGGWFESDKVRFRSGFPEKIGGWASISRNTFLGVARSLWTWVTLKSYNMMGIGTNLKFYVEWGGVYNDITPLRETTGPGAVPPTASATFAATSGSTTITVTDANVGGYQVGDFVTFSGAVSLGGNITATVLNAEFQIVSYVSNTSYTIKSSIAANASDVGNGGGAVTSKYQITTGSAIYTTGTGWGAGAWNASSITYTANAGTDVISYTGTLVDGQIIQVFTTGATPSTIGVTPGGLFTGTPYYVVSASGSTCKLSLTSGGVAINITSAGTGIQSFGVSTDPWAHGWGTGYTSGIGIQLRLWSQTNFGQDLLFSPRGGALYHWAPGNGTTPAFTTRGTLVSGTDVPAFINQLMLADASRIVIAFGCNPVGAYGLTDQDPMLIRWTIQESYTDWTISALNQAGFYRLSHGSVIVQALQTRQEILVWTDSAIYAMQYLGPPYVYGFTLLADNTSIVSPNAAATANGVTYWMGTDKFYMYSGRVETLPCALRSYIFDDINKSQSAQFFAGTNEGFSEVWWFYCSSTSDVIDKYVIFNYLDRVWYYGTMGRTAWIDSGLRDYPQAATLNNLIVSHEEIVDDGTFDPPEPIEAYIQSSDFDIGDGHNYGFVWRMIPDITFDGSTTPNPNTPVVTFTLRPRQNPGSNYGVADTPDVETPQNYSGNTPPVGSDPQLNNGKHTYNVQQFTEIVYTRIRGRQMAFRISSSALGTQWQLGVPRIDVRPDGRR